MYVVFSLSYSIDLNFFFNQLGYDTRHIHARHAKRQLELEIEDAGGFVDEHYPTWYGADFSNVRLRCHFIKSMFKGCCSLRSFTMEASTLHMVSPQAILSTPQFYSGLVLSPTECSSQTSRFRSALAMGYGIIPSYPANQ